MIGLTPCAAPVFDRAIHFVSGGFSLHPYPFCSKTEKRDGSALTLKTIPDHKPLNTKGATHG